MSNLFIETRNNFENALQYFAKANVNAERANLYGTEMAKELNDENIESVSFEKTCRITINLKNGKSIIKDLI